MMRLKEWYGWHFPEMAKIIPDGVMYAKIIDRSGTATRPHSPFRHPSQAPRV
jgi:RNA processing factor Prp31